MLFVIKGTSITAIFPGLQISLVQHFIKTLYVSVKFTGV